MSWCASREQCQHLSGCSDAGGTQKSKDEGLCKMSVEWYKSKAERNPAQWTGKLACGLELPSSKRWWVASGSRGGRGGVCVGECGAADEAAATVRHGSVALRRMER
ncbi:uncharacterized protein UTRI_01241_B [Ustilago trichophora]|uniref:Uncharacterized protein n=1 Tax=Ustilago trichophora TaxID=86804 RepID=A0A5C3DTI0_9BASI|nr:uncharacterized protein UTRI_01241_B [Ustilago trichophora]